MRKWLVVACATLLSLGGFGCGEGGGDGSNDPRPPSYSFDSVYLQYRNYETATNNRYQVWVPLTKDSSAIAATDVAGTPTMSDSAGNPVALGATSLWEGTYMFLNCSVAPCSEAGPIEENGFPAGFDSLPADTYTFEVDTADGQTLTLDMDYAGQLILPYVASATMQSQWSGGDLVLSWINPTGATNWSEVDQLRIVLFDGTGKDVLYIRPAQGLRTSPYRPRC